MSAASDILAKIDRRKRRLQDDPIVIVAPLPEMFRDGLIETGSGAWRLWCECLESRKTHGGTVMFIVDNTRIMRELMFAVWMLDSNKDRENQPAGVKMLARPIELAILGR